LKRPNGTAMEVAEGDKDRQGRCAKGHICLRPPGERVVLLWNGLFPDTLIPDRVFLYRAVPANPKILWGAYLNGEIKNSLHDFPIDPSPIDCSPGI